MTRNFSIGAASDDTASGDVLDCKLHGGENPSVLGHRLCLRQHAFHGKHYKTHDTKIQPAGQYLQRVLKKSVVRHTQYSRTTCSERRELVFESTRR